jgi:WD40 repeat protein
MVVTPMRTLIKSLQRPLLSAAMTVAVAGMAAAQPATPASSPSTSVADIFVQAGHSSPVTMTRFSPDSQRIATCDSGGAVIGWDALSGRQYREVHGHTGMCLGLAFTPDGQNVLSSGGYITENEVVMTRWADGAVLQTWTGYKGQVVDLIATPDNQGVWALGDHNVLMRWALGAAAPVRSVPLLLPGEAASQVDSATMVMPRDQSMAFVGRKDGKVLLIDLSGSAAPALLASYPEPVFALALSPDGSQLAVSLGSIQGATNKDVFLLDAKTGKELRRFSGHSGPVVGLAFSPDGSLLASAGQLDLNALINGSSIRALEGNESVRLWRVSDGSLLADMRNQRNRNGTPFLRGSLAFAAPPAAEPQAGVRLSLAAWDEAGRVYALDDAKGLRLVHTLASRGLAPRQLKVSETAGRMLVSDGRPRVALPEVQIMPADIRREFGTDADWTPGREKRINELYGTRGLLSSVQGASMWDLSTGRMERVVNWQRAPVTDMGVDAQGRFTSVAPLFPGTILLAPVQTNLVREATMDAQGQVSLRHFIYEPWRGQPGEIFTAIPSPTAAGAPAAQPATPEPGNYMAELVVQSPSQQWTAVAGKMTQSREAVAKNGPMPRLFIQQRVAGGTQVNRYDIIPPGVVRAMAVSANDATLWVAGTKSGLPFNAEHDGYLMAIDLATGAVARSWMLAHSVTVDKLVAHPGGDLAVTDGTVALNVWDKRQAERKYRIQPTQGERNVRGLALSADGRSLVTSELGGVMTLWDWPADAPPKEKWARLLAKPSPEVLSFTAKDQRIAAGAADGSVRMLSGKDGEEIARMIRFDTGEWITITPEGYFVASTEGDRWVNVRMNGSVYGIDQFYDVFYRPDLVQRKLAGEDIRPFIRVTLQDALRDPPPSVSVKLPPGAVPTAGQKYRVSLEALAQGGGVGEVRVMHNGKLVEVFNRAVVVSGLARGPSGPPSPATGVRAVTAEQAEKALSRGLVGITKAEQDAIQARPLIKQVAGDVEVELAAGENEFSVIGFNGPGNLNARPVSQAVMAAGAAPAPRVFVLAVGVDRFVNANMAPTLQFAVKDATDFASAIREKLGGQYRGAPVVVKTLANEEATHAGLDAALAQLQKEVRTNDLLVWFVASHGTLDNNERYGIVMHDWDGQDLESSLFSTASILEASRRIKAFNQLLILDTCHAGGVSKLVSGLYDARLSVLARNMGLHVFASASATEEAMDGYDGNGLFTHNLLLGLKTAAADANADKAVTVNELGEYARSETMRVARLLRKRQEPLLMNFGKDVTVYELH